MRAHIILKSGIQVANGRTAVSCFSNLSASRLRRYQKAASKTTTMFFLLLLSCLLHLSIIQDGGQLQEVLRSAPCSITYIVVKRTAKIGRKLSLPPVFGLLIQICQWLCPDLYFRLNQPVGIAFFFCKQHLPDPSLHCRIHKSCVLKSSICTQASTPDTSV